ncbi:MAG: VOC family protein [Actinocrinis sp.]
MVYDFQVVIDCADPTRMTEFWTQALGYVEEPPPEGFETWEAALTAWKVPESEWNSAGAAVPPDFDPKKGTGGRPRLFFQRVPEGKTVKNRVHLDIRAGGGRSTPPEERWARAKARAAELEALGATKVREFDEGAQGRWIVMQDPEGNEFCVT